MLDDSRSLGLSEGSNAGDSEGMDDGYGQTRQENMSRAGHMKPSDAINGHVPQNSDSWTESSLGIDLDGLSAKL